MAPARKVSIRTAPSHNVPRHMLKSVLIANRGEIACRIMRSCKKLGIRTLLLVDPRDGASAARELADQVIAITSHLDAREIVRIAQREAVEGIHPGYGFLAENAEFAARVSKAGISFIGPTAASIRALGDKLKARALAQTLGVPLNPAFPIPAHLTTAALKRLQAAAERIGYPLLVKASAGGGGKGMRQVHAAAQLAEACQAAAREALAAFGDGAVYIEKLLPISKPGVRHIEVQVIGDGSGAIAIFGDRDCSLQRRHQKILEEAPAPQLPDSVRRALHEYAFKLCSQVHYRSAGTVEFLYLQQEQRLYFLEVNSRLQVEHPVTEMVTGYDLVELQLRIASGETLDTLLPASIRPLSPSQQWNVPCCGHAVEARLCAEDPRQELMPMSGSLHILSFPARTSKSPESVMRVDSGYLPHDSVTHHFDSLIAKLIASGSTRAEAFRNLQHLLTGSRLAGLASNLPLFSLLATSALTDPKPFSLSDLALRFSKVPASDALEARAAAISLMLPLLRRPPATSTAPALPLSPFQSLTFWQLGQPLSFQRSALVNQREYRVELSAGPTEITSIQVRVLRSANGQAISPFLLADLQIAATEDPRLERLAWREKAHIQHALLYRQAAQDWLAIGAESLCISPLRWQSVSRRESGSLDADKSSKILAPFPGKVVRIMVREQQKVQSNTPLLAFESMKMEHLVRAPRAAKVSKLLVKAEQVVSAQQELLLLE